MSSAGKEGVEAGNLAAAQKAYRQLVAKEERLKNRIVARDIALDKCMRALAEAKALILRLEMSEELKEATRQGTPKPMADPRSGTISLINRALREIHTARES